MMKPWIQYVVVAAITVAGLAVRFFYIPDHDIWWDEICTATRAMMPLTDLWNSLKYQGPSSVSVDSSPPLHHILIHFSLLIRQSSFFLKLPNILFGGFTIPVVFLLVRRLYGSRAGLYAALFVALSAMHVSYSRDARWYSLFYFVTLVSFTFLLHALYSGKKRHWSGFVIAATAMLYSSYMAIVFIASYGLIVAAWCLFFSRQGALPARRVFTQAAASFVVVFLLFAPWIPGQINAYLVLYSDGPRPEFTLSGFIALLQPTLAPFYSSVDTKWMVSLLLAGGTACFLLRKRYFSISAVWLWAIVPLVAAYNVKTVNTISFKYVLFMLFVMSFFVGAFVDYVIQLFVRFLPRLNEYASVLIGLSCVFAFSYLSWKYYPGHLMDGMQSDKSAMNWLVSNRYNADYIIYTRSRQINATVKWYVPDGFREIYFSDPPGYKRCILVGSAGKRGEAVEGWTSVGDFRFKRIGLLNRSPLIIAPGKDGRFSYEGDYSGPSAYADARAFDNVSVNQDLGRLELHDLSRRGSLTYTFANPYGLAVEGVRISLDITLGRSEALEPDCSVSMSVVGPDGSRRLLRVMDASLFPRSGGSVRLEEAVPLDMRGGDECSIVFEFGRGIKHGEMAIKSFSAVFSVKDGGRGIDAGRFSDLPDRYASHISSRTLLAPEYSGARPITSKGIFAFKAGETRGAQALALLKKDYPSMEPVYTLRASDGAPVWEYYDPLLADPFLELSHGESGAVTSDSPKQEHGAYVVRGQLDFPTLVVDGREYPLTMKLPAGSIFTRNEDGTGTIALRPLYTEGGFMAGQIGRYRDVKKLSGQDCLSCTGKDECELSYEFRSIYPVRKAKVVWYPRLESDTQRRNRVALSVSADGGQFHGIGSYESSGSGMWDGPVRKVSKFEFSKPANAVTVRFTMSGDAAQIWSDPDCVLTLELEVDARTAPPLGFPSRSEVSFKGGMRNKFGIFLPESPPIESSRVEHHY